MHLALCLNTLDVRIVIVCESRLVTSEKRIHGLSFKPLLPIALCLISSSEAFEILLTIDVSIFVAFFLQNV